MSETKLLNLTNDYIFKRTFGYTESGDITKILLRDILQDNINSIELNNQTITEKELMDDKVGIMDIKAVLNENTPCDIEMQVILTDVLEIVIIELPKYMKYAKKEKRENLNLWLEFLKNPEVKIMLNEKDSENIKETKQAINKAQKELEKISKNEHERYLAELREKYIRDQVAVQEYGYIHGEEEGRKKQSIKIAKKMLEKNENIEYIMDITGLTKEEIEEIIK